MSVMDGSRWILTTLLALSGLACSKSNVSPAPWAEADASLDKVGVPVVLHFIATITSLPGTSCFAGVSGKVIVDEFYNTGK
jgi:hypothetical protein